VVPNPAHQPAPTCGHFAQRWLGPQAPLWVPNGHAADVPSGVHSCVSLPSMCGAGLSQSCAATPAVQSRVRPRVRTADNRESGRLPPPLHHRPQLPTVDQAGDFVELRAIRLDDEERLAHAGILSARAGGSNGDETAAGLQYTPGSLQGFATHCIEHCVEAVNYSQGPTDFSTAGEKGRTTARTRL